MKLDMCAVLIPISRTHRKCLLIGNYGYFKSYSFDFANRISMIRNKVYICYLLLTIIVSFIEC